MVRWKEEPSDHNKQAAERLWNMDSMSLAHAIDGFELSLRARSLSINTITDYLRTLTYLQRFISSNPPISQIKKEDIETFLSSQAEHLSKKSLLNRWIGLSAFWTWCVSEGLCKDHIIRKIHPPKPESKIIDPMKEEEVRALLNATQRSKSYRLKGVPLPVDFSLHYSNRNRAIILMLLDTGLRASELCSLSIKDVDIKSGHLIVMGKGNKQRQIPFSPRTGQAVWRYLGQRQDPNSDDPLFLSQAGRRMERKKLATMLSGIGKRAHIQGRVHPHRFRHTFAINYLRNGGDIYTLQKILGHTTLEMPRRYLAIAQIDLEMAHRRASPVDNWRL